MLLLIMLNQIYSFLRYSYYVVKIKHTKSWMTENARGKDVSSFLDAWRRLAKTITFLWDSNYGAFILGVSASPCKFSQLVTIYDVLRNVQRTNKCILHP